MPFKDRIRWAGAAALLIVSLNVMSMPPAIFQSLLHDVPGLEGESDSIADLFGIVLVGYGCVWGGLALIGVRHDPRFAALRMAVPVAAGLMVAANLCVSFLVGFADTPGPEESFDSGWVVSLLCPTAPLLICYFRRWPGGLRRPGSWYPRAPWGQAPAPHAVLPPYPRPGYRPLPGQVWEVHYPYEEQAGSKRRPALVIAVGPRDIRALKITSQDKSGYRSHYMPIDNSGWQAMNRRGGPSWIQLVSPAPIPLTEVHRPLGLCPQSLWNHLVQLHRLRVQTTH